MALTSTDQHLPESNHNTGEVNVNYQWKVLPWYIQIIITWLWMLICHLHFIHTLVRKKSKTDAPGTHAHMKNIHQNLIDEYTIKEND